MTLETDFITRKWVRPEDLNPNGTLFGGALLRWIDEEAGVYAVLQLGTRSVATKYISEVEFVSSATSGDLIEISMVATHFGTTSFTMRVEVTNMFTGAGILTIEKMVFVALDEHGKPTPHGASEITKGPSPRKSE